MPPRRSTAIICILLLGHALLQEKPLTLADYAGAGGDGEPKGAGQSVPNQQQQHQQQQARQQSQQDIDLVELSPNMEQQLQQALQLNRQESADDRMRFEDALRYEMAPTIAWQMPQALPGDRPLVQPATNWFERNQLMSNLRRRSSGSSGSALGPRHSRGLASYYRTGEEVPAAAASMGGYHGLTSALRDDQKEDKAYEFVGLSTPSAASIGNHESASRDSLWTSNLLRDLMHAQEASNRVRILDQLRQAARRKAGAKSNRATAGPNGGPNGIEVFETREKKRRCKVDPNLGVKNPSFCDTDAYFGAADYSVRDVWDSAGR